MKFRESKEWDFRFSSSIVLKNKIKKQNTLKKCIKNEYTICVNDKFNAMNEIEV